jgi:hypothetical protein
MSNQLYRLLRQFQQTTLGKKSVRLIFLILGQVMLTTSCQRPVSPEEYLVKVGSDPDFASSWKEEDFHASAVFRPSDWIALAEQRQSIEDSGYANAFMFTKQKGEFAHTAYFIFTLGKNNGSDLLQSGLAASHEYSIRLNYLTNSITKDFYLLKENGEKTYCILSELQRNYGMSPDLTFILGFPNHDLLMGKGSLYLSYEDKVFGLGTPVKIVFQTDKLLKSLPAIRI